MEGSVFFHDTELDSLIPLFTLLSGIELQKEWLISFSVENENIG